MPEWLLTKEEMARVYFESESTPTLPSEALAQAQLKKVALYLRDNYYAPDRAVYFSPLTWAALLREAGLEDKETPDA